MTLSFTICPLELLLLFTLVRYLTSHAMLTHLGIDSFIFLELFLFKSRHIVVLYLKLRRQCYLQVVLIFCLWDCH